MSVAADWLIALHHALRVGRAAFGGEGDVVDVVAAIGGQLDAVDRLGIGAARLGELARHAADLHHRQLRRIGQHDRHLQDDAERVADVVGVEFGEAFGAIAALEQERLAFRDAREIGGQVARFAGEDQRGIGAELLGRGGERGGVGIGGELARFVALPAVGGPMGGRAAAIGACTYQSA